MAAPATRPAAARIHRFSPTIWAGLAIAASAAVLLVMMIMRPSGAPGPIDNPSPTASESAAEATVSPSPTMASGSPSPAPTDDAAPTPQPSRASLTWSDPVAPSATINLLDVLPWRDGYVATGLVWGEAAFLTSPDGLNWTVAQSIARDSGAPVEGWRLAALDDALFAFSGSIVADEAPNQVISPPLVFRSVDGVAWGPVESPTWAAAWTGRILLRVASGPGGIVAIGNSVAGEHGQLFADPIVLRSTDGLAWAPGTLTDAPDHAVAWDVIGWSGGFVLLGGDQSGIAVGEGLPAAWWSPDGLSWTRSTLIGATVDDHHFEPRTGFAARDGLIARTQLMSAGGPSELRAWVSADGKSWQRADALGVQPPSGMMAGDGVRLVAFDTDEGWTPLGTNPDPYPGLTRGWISTDGSAWEPLDLSAPMTDPIERFWLVPDGVIYAGAEAFWFGVLGR